MSDAPAISLTHLNLGGSDQEAFAYLNESGGDILLIQELTHALVPLLPEALSNYEPVLLNPNRNTHGSGILRRKGSAVTVESTEIVVVYRRTRRPIIQATLRVDDEPPITLLNLHLTRSRNYWTTQSQLNELAGAAEWGARQTTEMIVIGDFNTTPWAPEYKRFLQVGGLVDSTTGFGFQPTWAADRPVVMQIPIDQAAVSAGLQVVARSTGPNVGSDHRPLHLTIKQK